jgi:hypothetical protein
MGEEQTLWSKHQWCIWNVSFAQPKKTHLGESWPGQCHTQFAGRQENNCNGVKFPFSMEQKMEEGDAWF